MLLCAVWMYKLHLESKAVLLHHGSFSWVSHDRREYRVSTAMSVVPARGEVVLCEVMLWLLCQPGDNKHSAVPAALPAYSTCLAYPGFNDECK